jgi:hypothetical protein
VVVVGGGGQRTSLPNRQFGGGAGAVVFKLSMFKIRVTSHNHLSVF